MYYYVAQPIMNNGPDRWESATLISRHRTQMAAEFAIERATRRLRRQPGQRNSWLDWYVVGADELSASKRAGYRAK